MKTLIAVFALVTITSASIAPHGGAVVSGPSGVVTNYGAIGPNGLPNGVGVLRAAVAPTIGIGAIGAYAAPAAVAAYAAPAVYAAPAAIAAPAVSTTFISRPAVVSTGVVGVGGYGWGAGVGGLGAGIGGLGAGIGGLGARIGGLGVGGAVGVGHGGIITNGGGTIGISGHGVTVRGPPTAPAVIAGPSGKVAADGLWGPTATWATGGYGAHGW